MNKGLTYDDVCLIPQYNDVPSRLEPELDSWLTRTIKVGCPIIPANMDCVIGEDLARVVLKNKAIPIFHRFASHKQQLDWLREFKAHCFFSAGVRSEDLDFIEAVLATKIPILGVCFDVAHGHSKMMKAALIGTRKLCKKYGQDDLQIIAGNICTPMAYSDLESWGADAIKVGCGCGAACTTRGVTGFGVPQFTAVYECAKVAKKLRIPIIADGGIRSSNDILKALAAGASMVMIGKLFAGTNESAAGKVHHHDDDFSEAYYRGQASMEFQLDHFGKVKKGTVPEGESMHIPVTGSAQELIDRLLGGLRQGMTLGGARDIKELQRKAEFMEVTPNYQAESNVRT